MKECFSGHVFMSFFVVRSFNNASAKFIITKSEHPVIDGANASDGNVDSTPGPASNYQTCQDPRLV